MMLLDMPIMAGSIKHMETLEQILTNLKNNPNAYNNAMNEDEHMRLDERREL
jgi:hypothetical protein